MKNRELVDDFIIQKRIPSDSDMKRWNIDMIAYYKQRMALLVDKGEVVNNEKESTNKEEDDMVKYDLGIAHRCWNIKGLSTSDKQNEVRNFIANEGLSTCDVLETHIKSKSINKVGNDIFGRWEWYSNMKHCDKGCRIMLGWNVDHVYVNLIHSDKQCMFCEITTVNGNKRVLCTFVYAANGGKERKYLWRNLIIQKKIVGNNAWLMMGNINEHSAGSSCMSSDMNDFKDCINHIKMEDIASSVIQDKKRAFKFTNFIAEKKELLPTVRKGWEDEYEGCEMFKTIKKLKGLKRDLKKLTWKDGNIFDKVNCLKMQLKDVQLRIDKDPYDKDLRNEESKCLSEYVEAMKDKEKMLYQKAKIKWLSVGDRNNAYFHRVLKNRNHKNIINSIRDGKGNLYKEKDVADQFVNHFQAFLGNTETVKDCDYIIPLIKKKLNAYTTNFMVRDVCGEEIKAAMFQIESNKAPRLDGFLFFKKAWSIMSEDVCSAINDLLMFCNREKRSVQILKEAIEDFGLVSGLLPNYSKSTIIFGSVGMKDKQAILECVVNEDVSDSWAWKNILNLRNDVRKFIFMNVGNGETTSVIYDNWCEVGILQSFITHRDLYNARINANMVVKDIVENGICMWPKEWVSKYPVLGLHKNITLIADKRDKIIWRTKDGKDVQFTVNQTYNDLGSNDAKDKIGVSCTGMVWNDIIDSFLEMYSGNSIDSIIKRLGIRFVTLKAKNSKAVISAQKRWNVKFIYPDKSTK
ncbi:RNA-directed DNA polymerase, eukaryota, reverse transcriptase zinc-binding domain protein [Tanacetum coccineum]|uniref:RNA-directed DNA polymerase, eukaryota, reverse transcriptase zinc-binding domain protein n=1 Tax=Tanacetum coccineum TaxID=301880 RepID=A0ABQ4ZA07_9ASTR